MILSNFTPVFVLVCFICVSLTTHPPKNKPRTTIPKSFFIKKPYQIPDSLWTQLDAIFDVILKNNEEYKESDTYTPGSSLKTMEINGQLMGHSICYDLRFPKLYRELSKKSCKAIVVPSAFTYTTGKAHWHCLLRARAIENGVFIIAPNQWGTNEENRSTYGHSLVVNPWGEIISEATDSEMVLNCEIDLNIVENFQNSIPVLKHDRNFN